VSRGKAKVPSQRPPVQITARLDATLAEQVDAFAQNYDKSVNWVVKNAIQEFIERYAGPGGTEEFIKHYVKAAQGSFDFKEGET